MSGSGYPPEKLTERYTPPNACGRFLLALDVVSGDDTLGFGWFTSFRYVRLPQASCVPEERFMKRIRGLLLAAVS